MDLLEAKSIAVLTLFLVLGIFQQNADRRAAPVECSAAAQDPAGTLSGTVSDISGAGISGASITAVCDSFHRTVITDLTGVYSLRLPAGRYHVRVTAKDFTPAERDIVVSAGSPVVEWKPTLTLAPIKATVLVAGPGYAVANTTTGTKMDASLLDVPQSITVVDHELLGDQGVHKLDDALKNVAGVMPGGYYEAWDFYRLRGFDASFNTYIDGLRGGNGMGEETFGLESVEVLKGPSSTLYGQSVPGGIVNLRSKLPRPDAFAHFQFTGGSYGLYEPAIDAGASLNRSRTLYARLNLLYRQTDSFVDYVSRHRVYVAPALTWAINPDTQLTFLGRYQHDTDHLAFPLPARGTVLPNANGEIPISRFVGEPSNPNPVAEFSYHFGYQLTHRFNDSLSLYQNLRFSWYQNHWDKLLYPSFLGADQRTLFRYPLSWREEWSNYVADTGLLVRAHTGRVQHDVVAGVEYYREPRKYSSESINFGDTSAYMPLDVFNPVYGTSFSTLRPFISGDTRKRYIGLYLQDRLQLTQRLSLTAGGRLDFVSDRDFSVPDSNDNHAFSPRLGATYGLGRGVALYANYSKSFLPQTGIVYDGSSSGAFADPEKGEQWEFGVKAFLFSGRMVNTFSVYRLTRNNVLTLDPNHPNFYVVTGTQRSKGVEFETVLQPRESWNVILAYAFTDARVVTDTVIPSGTRTQNVPRHSTNLWTTYELPHGLLRGVGFGFGARYYTDQSGDPLHTFSIPAYGLMDGSIFYRRGRWGFQLNAYNLANKRYFTGSYDDVYVLPGSPRSIQTTISWRF